MRRRLVTFCSALWPLLFVAVCMLWVRSFGSHDGFYWSRPTGEGGRIFALDNYRGSLRFIRFPPAPSGLPAPPRGWVRRPVRPGERDIPDANPPGRLGFAWGATDRVQLATGTRYRRVSVSVVGQTVEALPGYAVVRVPLWFLAIASGAPPAMAVVARVRRRHRHVAGLCPTCGYDLRATPDRCPECGRAAGKAAGSGDGSSPASLPCRSSRQTAPQATAFHGGCERELRSIVALPALLRLAH